jgi:hypothetical protein
MWNHPTMKSNCNGFLHNVPNQHLGMRHADSVHEGMRLLRPCKMEDFVLELSQTFYDNTSLQSMKYTPRNSCLGEEDSLHENGQRLMIRGQGPCNLHSHARHEANRYQSCLTSISRQIDYSTNEHYVSDTCQMFSGTRRIVRGLTNWALAVKLS